MLYYKNKAIDSLRCLDCTSYNSNCGTTANTAGISSGAVATEPCNQRCFVRAMSDWSGTSN